MFDNGFEIKIGMQKFYSVHVLKREISFKVVHLGYLGFETKEEVNQYIDKVKEEKAFLFFNVQKIKLKYGKVKAF